VDGWIGALLQSHALADLDLSGVELDAGHFRTLGDAFAHTHRLQAIHLVGCKFTPRIITALCTSLLFCCC